MDFDPRRRGRGCGVFRGWGAPRGRGIPEGGARGVGIGATQARGAGGGRLVFATAKSLWVYYKAELGGRGAGQSRQSLSQRKESGSRELTPAGGTCSPRSLRTASLWADAWNRKAQPNQQSRPAAPLNPQLRPAQPAELPPPVWAA